MKFVKADKPDTGKKFAQVTKMLDTIRKSDDPVPFDDLCKTAGAKYPQDVQAAMFALELTGLVDRYTYVEDGSTRAHVAYQWAGGDNGSRPTSAASSGSKKRSQGSQAKAGKARQAKAKEAATA